MRILSLLFVLAFVATCTATAQPVAMQTLLGKWEIYSMDDHVDVDITEGRINTVTRPAKQASGSDAQSMSYRIVQTVQRADRLFMVMQQEDTANAPAFKIMFAGRDKAGHLQIGSLADDQAYSTGDSALAVVNALTGDELLIALHMVGQADNDRFLKMPPVNKITKANLIALIKSTLALQADLKDALSKSNGAGMFAMLVILSDAMRFDVIAPLGYNPLTAQQLNEVIKKYKKDKQIQALLKKINPDGN